MGLQDVASLEEASKTIRELIRTTPLPEGDRASHPVLTIKPYAKSAR